MQISKKSHINLIIYSKSSVTIGERREDESYEKKSNVLAIGEKKSRRNLEEQQ
jgi:hypothetical protein